jgi:type I restriction enzyme M protein
LYFKKLQKAKQIRREKMPGRTDHGKERPEMIGAVAGDIIGSVYEFRNRKSKRFPLFGYGCSYTDDSVMTLALCDAILMSGDDRKDLSANAVRCMQDLGRRYPYCGFGGMFRRWLFSDDPAPYNSFGNGAAMRVSGAAYAGETLEEVLDIAVKITEVTHDHPEGIKGAQAAAAATFLARSGAGKDEIRKHIEEKYYPLDFTLKEIRPDYRFDVTCQGSVPQALEAFLESRDFEDAVRNAVSIGGDSDTIAAITGAVAEAYYGVPDRIRAKAESYLDSTLLDILRRFEERYPSRKT